MNSRPIRLLRNFATVGVWTMASRVLGFLRDICMANVVGAGPLAEALFVAFRLPNMFRRFFAEGAFNMAFVPMLTKKLEDEGPDAARQFGSEALSVLAAALIVLTILAQLAMPWLILGLASGYAGDGRLDLAVAFSRVIFPYILFISLAALFSGILNAFGRFAAAAAAPVLLNVIWIGALGLIWFLETDIGGTLSWAIFVAGLAQLGLVWFAARQLGMGLTLRRPRLTSDVRRLIVIGIPAALAGGVMQVNILVGTQVASYFAGAVGWLWYADRLYQLPLGVVGVAIGVVLLPDLTRRFRAGDSEGTARAMNRAGEFSLILTLPATVALIVIPGVLVSALFEHGAFTAEDTAKTALALAIYALSLPAFVLQKVLQPAYFAREDTRSPLRFAVVSMIVNVVVAIGMAPVIGFLSAPLGTALAGLVNLALLWRGVRRLDPMIVLDQRLARRTPRMVLAALGMGAVVYGLADLMPALLPGAEAFGLLVIVVGGMIAYGVLGSVLSAFSVTEIRNMIRRRGAAG